MSGSFTKQFNTLVNIQTIKTTGQKYIRFVITFYPIIIERAIGAKKVQIQMMIHCCIYGPKIFIFIVQNKCPVTCLTKGRSTELFKGKWEHGLKHLVLNEREGGGGRQLKCFGKDG